MAALTDGYKKLLAAIFERAYIDLVSSIRKAERFEKRKNDTLARYLGEKDERRYKDAMSTVTFLETWIRAVMPAWLDIDPESYIRWAHEEAQKPMRRRRSEA